ncbi:hypothetical protein BOX15_Mlig020263g8, partial [Macrostomum lignano]
SLHLSGARAVSGLQTGLMPLAQPLMLLSDFGHPVSAFIIAFPLCYALNSHLGLTVLWSAAFSEWLNGLLKWALHGERPYWWVGERLRQVNLTLAQFPQTCETGPGSPSGHCMVAAASWYIPVLYASQSLPTKSRLAVRYAYFAGITALGVSRCFLATHFPHQAVGGVITGCLLSIVAVKMGSQILRPFALLLLAFLMFSSSLGVSHCLRQLGLDPDWSIRLAERHCASSEWVSIDTTPLFSIHRDIGAILGAAFSSFLASLLPVPAPSRTVTKCFAGFLSMCACVLLEKRFQPKPGFSDLQTYLFAAFKYALMPLIVTIVLPVLAAKLDSRRLASAGRGSHHAVRPHAARHGTATAAAKPAGKRSAAKKER